MALRRNVVVFQLLLGVREDASSQGRVPPSSVRKWHRSNSCWYGGGLVKIAGRELLMNVWTPGILTYVCQQNNFID